VPALETIRFRMVENDSRAFEMIQTKAVNMAPLSPEQHKASLEDANFQEHFHLFEFYAPQGGCVFYGWNCRRTPFDDVRVRRAMAHLVSRQEIIDKVYLGYARPAAVPFWSEGPLHPQDLEPVDFNLSAAEQLLDEAGWVRKASDKGNRRTGLRHKGGQPLTARIMAVEHERRHRAMADMLVARAQEAGCQFEVQWVSWHQMQQAIAGRDFDVVLTGWSTAPETDPYLLFHSSQTADGGLNFVGFSDAEADRLTELLRRETDPAVRTQLARQLAAVLLREQPYTTLIEPCTLVAVDARFQGIQRYRLGFQPHRWYIPRQLRLP
jgi:peptide/nickel transport system substrate-binding protein